MQIKIQKGSYEYLGDCVEALLYSDIGKTYFNNEAKCQNAIKEGLEQGSLYVALADKVCAGFIWYLPKGAFHSFPYLHIISIKDRYRGKGIGKKLIRFIEDIVFAEVDKLFLVVADFNLDARRLYERIGYQKVGELPNLYKNGVTEYLMMKKKEMLETI